MFYVLLRNRSTHKHKKSFLYHKVVVSEKKVETIVEISKITNTILQLYIEIEAVQIQSQ